MLVVELVFTDDALVLDFGQYRAILLWLNRIGRFHGLRDEHHAVIEGNSIGFRWTTEFLLVRVGKSLSFLGFLQHGAALATVDTFTDGITAQTAHFRRANTIATEQHCVDAQLLHLTLERSTLWRIAAEENSIWLLALDRGQNGSKVTCLVVGEVFADNLDAVGLCHFDELFGQTLTVGSTVIDDRNGLDLQLFGGIQGHLTAQLAVAGGDAKQIGETLLGNFGIGRHSCGDDTSVVIDPRSRNGDARVVRADNRLDTDVNQLLRSSNTGLRICLVVFCNHFELDFFAADDQALRIQTFDRQLQTALIVLAGRGLWPGQRTAETNLHRLYFLGKSKCRKQGK